MALLGRTFNEEKCRERGCERAGAGGAELFYGGRIAVRRGASANATQQLKTLGVAVDLGYNDGGNVAPVARAVRIAGAGQRREKLLATVTKALTTHAEIHAAGRRVGTIVGALPQL